LIIFQRAPRVGRVVRCLFLSILKQLGLRPFSNKLAGALEPATPYANHCRQSHFDMDDAFCARMRAAIKAGLERAPLGVITTPGTTNPKYAPAEPWPLASSLGAIKD
jgi:hypothetical protein